LIQLSRGVNFMKKIQTLIFLMRSKLRSMQTYNYFDMYKINILTRPLMYKNLYLLLNDDSI
jgi:hypothetical protein